MEQLLERLKRGRVLVADGALGTMLLQQGLEPGKCPESVNLTRPDTLEIIARGYLEAGADIIQTNTFGASPQKLAQYKLEHETVAVNRNAVLAVRNVVGERAYVCGSCGPSGRVLKPYGDTDPADVCSSFRRQMEILIDAGVDCICVETMVDLAEATLAIKAARDVSRAIPVMATMTFDATPKGFFTIMGVNIRRAASGLRDAGADVVGSNCGNGIENMIKIAGDFRRCSDLPLIFQSNAGVPETQDGTLSYSETPALMAERAKELIAAGASIIGGCCGTTPEHTKALRAMVDSLPSE